MVKHAFAFLAAMFGMTAAFTQTAPTVQWGRVLGGFSEDEAYAILQTDDGYLVCGYAWSNDGDMSGNHGGRDAWLIKLDNDGGTVWQRLLGGTAHEFGYDVQHTSDGGFIMAGSTSSNNGDVSGNHGGGDGWAVKLDDTGNIEWQRALGGSGYEEIYAVQQTTDGGYVVVGYTTSNDGDVSGNHGDGDAWIAKLSVTGVIDWQRTMGGSGFDEAKSVGHTSDGGYIVAGTTTSNNGDVSGNHGIRDAWVIKLTEAGNITWQKALGGSGYDEGYSIQQTVDGGYIVAGTTGSNDGDISGNHGALDAWVVKLNNTGNIIWQNALGGTNNDVAVDAIQTIEGGYMLAGISGSNNGDVSGNQGGDDAWVVKVNDQGMIIWQKSFGGSGFDIARGVQQTTNGGFVLAGGSNSNSGDFTGNNGATDAWVVKLSPDEVGVAENDRVGFMIYPNPSTGLIRIQSSAMLQGSRVTVLDIFGREIQRSILSATSHTLDISGNVPGLYMVTVYSELHTMSSRLIVE